VELSKSLENDEYFTDAYILRGKILWTMGKKKEGNIEFWKAEAIDPDHPEICEFLKIIKPEIAEFKKQTNEAIINNDLTRAFILVNKGLSCQPGDSSQLIKRAFIQRKWMNFNSALKDLELASQKMNQYGLKDEIKKQISLTYNEMGQYLYQGRQYEQALQLFNEAQNFDQSDHGVIINQGDCYRKLGSLD
jgi:tetratricopeptide (TPR) repeat protein